MSFISNMAWLWTHNLAEKEQELMATLDQFNESISAINDAVTAVAAEVARLREIIAQSGLTAEQETAILAQLDAIEDKLTGVVTPPPPEPTA